LVLIALSACEVATTPPEQISAQSLEMTVSPQQATATAAVVTATAVAAAQQGTLDAAQATVQQQNLIATQQAAQVTAQAQATASAQAALTASAQQLTAQAQAEAAATATAQQLAAQAQATATEEAARSTATAEALSRDATATERAYSATTTTEALNRELTAAAVALQVTQAALAEEAQRRQEAFRTAFAVVGAGLVLSLIVVMAIGLRWLSQERAAASPDALAAGETLILREGPCPPIMVQPDGTVQIPLLEEGVEQTCTLSQGQLTEVLNWARSGAQGGEDVLPPLPASGLPAPGLRSIHSLRRLEQAEKSGAISPELVAALEADWDRGLGV
jgi:hypothetical protein